MTLEEILKITEIFADVVTPVAVIFIGFYINKNLKRLEHDRQKAFKKKEMQKEIYDDIYGKLNIIFCYVADVGDFGDYTPEDIIDQKRYVDRRFKSYRPLWSGNTEKRYNQFMTSCFDHFAGGLGTPARIQTSSKEKRGYFKNINKIWNTKWDSRFTGKKDSEIFKRYDDMTEAFLREFVD